MTGPQADARWLDGYNTAVEELAENLVGIAEIAARCGVSRQAVTNWQRRWSDFPKPLAELACGPIYDWSQIEEYMNAGRVTLSGAR